MTISKKQSNLMDTYLKFSGGYRLANLKKSNMTGLENPGFDADLSFDGVIIGSVKDGGDGGPGRAHHRLRASYSRYDLRHHPTPDERRSHISAG